MKLKDITTGVVERPPRMIVCGTEKIGKSTFACSSEAPVVIPIKGEEGVDDLDVSKFPVANSYDDVMSAIETLYGEKHDFKTVVIDSLSTFEPLVWDKLCKDHNVDSIEKVGGGFGKGYVEAAHKFRELLAGLDALRDQGMTSILICHVAVKTFTDPLTDSYDQYVLDLNRQAASALMRWADNILFCNCKVATKADKEGFKQTRKAILRDERVLFTQKRPTHPGGGRGVYGQLPYELPLEWGAYIEAIKQAKHGGNHD